jgi:hypothetical protein
MDGPGERFCEHGNVHSCSISVEKIFRLNERVCFSDTMLLAGR